MPEMIEPPPPMVISSATFAVDLARLQLVRDFYVRRLGLAEDPGGGRSFRVAVGPARLGFAGATAGAHPFYHFALLVPGDRFEAARDWLAARAGLLSRPGESDTTFRFEAWDALACYAHDPAGNVVELIAHRGLEEAQATGPFTPVELRGISEVGLVVADLAASAATLRAAGLVLWSGSVEDDRGLGFVGRRAHTFILSGSSRAWLPTRRAAESHPLTATLRSNSGSVLTVRLDGGRIIVSPAPS